MLKAPWTDSEVYFLNKFQNANFFHPYTCGNGCGALVATREGWVCSLCDYIQNWAHAINESLLEELQNDLKYDQKGLNSS